MAVKHSCYQVYPYYDNYTMVINSLQNIIVQIIYYKIDHAIMNRGKHNFAR